jgi:hypothetical protein
MAATSSISTYVHNNHLVNAVDSSFSFYRSLPATIEVKEPSIMMQSLSQVPLDDDDEKSRKNLSTYTYEDLCIACTKVINKECTGAAAIAAYQIPKRSFYRAMAAFKKTGVVPDTRCKQGAPPQLSEQVIS